MTLHSGVFARSWPTTMTRRLVLPPLKQWWGITMDSSTPTQWSVKRALGKVAEFIAQVVEIDRKRPGHSSNVECG